MSPARVLMALSSDTPFELVAPVEAALVALGLEVHRVDLGRITTGTGVGVIDRVAKALLGEVEHRRLEREIAAFVPDVAVALDPGATAALVRERDRAGAHAAPVVAIVPELGPRPAWAVDADRYVAIDDEAAVALGELGVDGARVHVEGAIVKHAWAIAAREDRAVLRTRFKLPADEAVVLVEAGRLPAETLSQLALQLALLDGKPAVLFEAGDDAQVAAQLRRQVPPLGIRAKLFGDTADAPLLWRAADVVVARPRPRAIMTSLAVGAAFIAIEPSGEREQAEARALEERGIGATAKVLLVAAALGPLCKDARVRAAAARAAEARGRPASLATDGSAASGDAADAIATLVRDVAADREAVLAETRAARVERAAAFDSAREASAAADARRATPPGDLEDLGGDDFTSSVVDDLGEPGGDAAPSSGASSRTAGASGPSGPDPAALTRLRAELDTTEMRLRKELAEVRADADRWAERRVLAERKGDLGLAADAGREADRKRARAQMVQEELARIAAERKRLASMTTGAGGGSASSSARRPAATASNLDDELEAMKRSQRQRSSSVDDELEALKRKMRTEGKKK